MEKINNVNGDSLVRESTSRLCICGLLKGREVENKCIMLRKINLNAEIIIIRETKLRLSTYSYWERGRERNNNDSRLLFGFLLVLE